VAQRIVRTKAKIRETPIPVRGADAAGIAGAAAIPASADSAVEIKVWWRIVREKRGTSRLSPTLGIKKVTPNPPDGVSTMEVLWTLPRFNATDKYSHEFI
jgi:hypothetical protein